MKRPILGTWLATLFTGLALAGNDPQSPPPSASPSTSALPSASASPPPPTKEQLEAAARTEAADFLQTCAKDFHLPFSRRMIFSLDGTSAYLMLPVAKQTDGDASTKSGKEGRRSLPPERKIVYYSLQIGPGIAIPEFGLRNTLSADLLVTMDPTGFAASAAAVVTEPAAANCGRGDLELVAGTSGGSGPVRRKGFLGVLPYFRIPVILDAVNRNLLQLDTVTMQSRTLFKVPADVHPIHVDPVAGKLTTWDSKTRTLSILTPKTNTRPATVKVKAGYQVLLSGGRIAALKTDTGSNTITIHEIPAWTGVTKESEFSFRMPPANGVGQAQVWPNFDRKIALVTARSDDIRRRWQKVFVIDYASGRVQKEFTTKGTDYFAEVGISPNTKSVVLVHMNGSQSVADKLIIADLAKDTTKEVNLPVP